MRALATCVLLLAGLAASHEDEWYLERPDTRLYVLEIGQGAPVVVLHGGFGAEHSYLLDLVRPLQRERRFVLYDQRGSLRSPASVDTVSIEAHLEDLEALRVALGLEEVTLLAHSMGTFLAMAYLERYPERIDRLILLGAVPATSPPPEGEDGRPVEASFDMQTWSQRPAYWETLRNEGLALRERDELRADLTDREKTHAWRINFAAVNTFHVERWRQMKGGQVFYAAEAGQAAARTMPEEFDFLVALDDHDRPTRVLLGDHDFVDWGATYWSWAAQMSEQIDLHVLPQAGHNAWIDSPDEVRSLLEKTLRR